VTLLKEICVVTYITNMYTVHRRTLGTCDAYYCRYCLYVTIVCVELTGAPLRLPCPFGERAITCLINCFCIFIFSNQKCIAIIVLQDNKAEQAAAETLSAVWSELVLKSKNVDASLGVVKRKFTQVILT